MAFFNCLEPGPKDMKFQQTRFWKCEDVMRLTNAAMTPLEQKNLDQLDISQLPSVHRGDVEKVLKNFGKAKGCLSPCRRLLEALSKKEQVPVGGKVPLKTVMFTLAKHLLLAERCMDQIREEPYNAVGCSCYAMTYIMPEGCGHNKVRLYKELLLHTTLCKHCSKCIRCGKLLGCIEVTYKPTTHFPFIIVRFAFLPRNLEQTLLHI